MKIQTVSIMQGTGLFLVSGRLSASVNGLRTTALQTRSRIIEKYYDTYNIPEEKQKVPSMVIGNRYLFGWDEIGERLISSLIAGDGLQTPLLNGSERKP